MFLLVSFTLISLLSVLFSYRLAGRFKLTQFSFDDLPRTYSTEKPVLAVLNHNRLSVSPYRLKKELERIPYVEKAEVCISGNTIKISGKAVEDAVVITDGTRFFFLADEAEKVDPRDMNDINGLYLILELDGNLLDGWIGSSFSGTEDKMLSVLKKVKTSSGLITGAEYDNNNSNVISGCLRLRLGSLRSVLVIKDIRDSARLGEAIEIIRADYSESADALHRKETEYILESGKLVRMR